MALTAILAGSATAVSDALASRKSWNRPGFSLKGAALIGAGEAPLPTMARAPLWGVIELPAGSRNLILVDPPSDGATRRVVLERAAAAHMKPYLLCNGVLRRLTLEDLIGRSRELDFARAAEMIAGKRVLITGGGGSIGGELARRVMSLEPQRLTLLDSSEHNLYRVCLDLPEATPVLADVRDAAAMKRWIKAERPDLVFHAAALKQVPIVEAFASEGVFTNLCGLRNVADVSHGIGADLIFVSTDKAVEPSGVMGASKRLGEIYCQALDRRGASRALSLRLGNVLGSAGSVKPLFEAQLARGGPLTVTHREVTRFFLSISQAADALLQAAAVGRDAPRGSVLAIDMGEALSVAELAREVVRLEGLRPDIDVPIAFTGLRPGEKLHELLVAGDEWSLGDLAPGVTAVSGAPRSSSEIAQIIERLAMLAREGANEAIVDELFAALHAGVEIEQQRQA
jgi:O-antigen biosynthesis protein WbqV